MYFYLEIMPATNMEEFEILVLEHVVNLKKWSVVLMCIYSFFHFSNMVYDELLFSKLKLACRMQT